MFNELRCNMKLSLVQVTLTILFLSAVPLWADSPPAEDSAILLSGHHHKAVNVPANRPEHNSLEGLVGQ